MEIDSRQGSCHRMKGSTWIDLGQCKDKSDYYHSFKTWLKDWPGVRPESPFKRVNSSWSKLKKKKIQSNIVLTRIFFSKQRRFDKNNSKKSQWIFYLIFNGSSWINYSSIVFKLGLVQVLDRLGSIQYLPKIKYDKLSCSKHTNIRQDNYLSNPLMSN